MTDSSQPGFDITPFIPRRTSSTADFIPQLIESLHPPFIRSNTNDKRQTDPIQPVPIQVTSDADMFCRLWIKEFSSAIEIKKAILQRLNIPADYRYFEFTHENGPYSDIALSDNELLYICQTSSNAKTNRVLVRPISTYIESPVTESPRLFSPGVHTPPANETRPLYDETAKTSFSSDFVQHHHHHQQQQHQQQQQQKQSLWAVAPKYGSESSISTSSSTKGISLFDPPQPKQQREQLPSPLSSPPPPPPKNGIGSQRMDEEELPSPAVSQQSSMSLSDGETTSNEEDMFGERPSVDKLYRDIDLYLPGHDLDKELCTTDHNQQQQQINNNNNNPLISVLPTNNNTPLVSRRALGHRPSVRVVAKEAHRRWKQATNVIRINQMLGRKKSTKMWGAKVERVKPGEEHLSVINSGMPTATNMKWMRGELIGKGSFGKVYHAFNTTMGEWIAVKQVDTAITKSDKRNKDLQEAADALYREISLLKDLDHENIVQYLGYDSDVAEGHIYIFLEYVPGGSISSLLSQFKPFDEDLTGFFTRQILEGLSYLHNRHILHRDIKSANVLIDQKGVCKIADFGLSKNQTSSAYDPHSDNSKMRGSIFWMAPEVLTGNYSAKIDIWSLGCTVLEMLTGELPWRKLDLLAAIYKIGTNNSPEIPNDITDDAKDFLKKCFIINPDDRPTADELLHHPFVKENPSFDFEDSIKDHKNRRKEVVDEPDSLNEVVEEYQQQEFVPSSHLRPTRQRRHDETKVTFAEHPQVVQATETDPESDYPSELASSENDSIKTTEAEHTPLLKALPDENDSVLDLHIPTINGI